MRSLNCGPSSRLFVVPMPDGQECQSYNSHSPVAHFHFNCSITAGMSFASLAPPAAAFARILGTSAGSR